MVPPGQLGHPRLRYRDEQARAGDEPYLLQHADNPVGGSRWGRRRWIGPARNRNRLIVSIGYSACHWCHVMEHERSPTSDRGPDERALRRVKVDREERPDVDAVYMDAVVALTGRAAGRSPSSSTPDGEPVLGGTYSRRSRGTGCSCRQLLAQSPTRTGSGRRGRRAGRGARGRAAAIGRDRASRASRLTEARSPRRSAA